MTTATRPAATHARPIDARVFWGALAWIIGEGQLLVVQIIVSGDFRPSYSWRGNYISDLGNTACGVFAVPHGTAEPVCSPWHATMNVSFVVAGVLTALGAVLLRPVLPARRMAGVAVALLVIAGVGKIGIGLVPENTNLGLHTLAALNAPISSVAILLIGLAVRRSQPGFSAFGIAMAILGLAGTALSVAGQYAGNSAYYLGLGVGGMERVANYPGLVWLVVAGLAVGSGLGAGRSGLRS